MILEKYSIPTQDFLKELFEYRDGAIYWKIEIGRKIKVGGRAGANKQRYRQVGVNGVLYLEHRIIWTLINGLIPIDFLIDHKDGNTLNNNIENLRLATHSQNCHNRVRYKNNKSGIKCVSWHSASQTWRVRIMKDGKCKYKHFHSLPDAKKCYETMVFQMHGEFSNIG